MTNDDDEELANNLEDIHSKLDDTLEFIRDHKSDIIKITSVNPEKSVLSGRLSITFEFCDDENIRVIYNQLVDEGKITDTNQT